MPRRARLDAPGCLHHVVARGIERRTIFADDIDRQDLVARIAGLAERTGTEVLAWALLPNHYHLLLRTAAAPLSDLMRCLNTGYAVGFNRRHHRCGYLFQNRFKSFLVEAEPYLLELVRYIHLNPVRARLLTLPELDTFPWTGHATLVGRIDRPWQSTRAVLALFARSEPAARDAYRQFVASGAGGGGPPERAAGGLRRTRGTWIKQPEKVRGRDLWSFDERILGSRDFVERVRSEHTGSAAANPPVLSAAEIAPLLSALLQAAATRCGVLPAEITSSSHRPAAVAGRSLIAHLTVRCLGISSNTVARFLGVTRQSVRRGLQRSEGALATLSCNPDEILKSILCAQHGGAPGH